MKTFFDSGTFYIEAEDGVKFAFGIQYGAYNYQAAINILMNDSQKIKHIEQDGWFLIGKKRWESFLSNPKFTEFKMK